MPGAVLASATRRFLILGSASMDRLRQSSESLAGRIEYVALHPFDVIEAAPDEESLHEFVVARRVSRELPRRQ